MVARRAIPSVIDTHKCGKTVVFLPELALDLSGLSFSILNTAAHTDVCDARPSLCQSVIIIVPKELTQTIMTYVWQEVIVHV